MNSTFGFALRPGAAAGAETGARRAGPPRFLTSPNNDGVAVVAKVIARAIATKTLRILTVVTGCSFVKGGLRNRFCLTDALKSGPSLDRLARVPCCTSKCCTLRASSDAASVQIRLSLSTQILVLSGELRFELLQRAKRIEPRVQSQFFGVILLVKVAEFGGGL